MEDLKWEFAGILYRAVLQVLQSSSPRQGGGAAGFYGGEGAARPGPARLGPARPSLAGAWRQNHLGWGVPNAKIDFLLCYSPLKSQEIPVLLPHISSNFDPGFGHF